MNALRLGAFLFSIPFTCHLLISQFPSHWLFPSVLGGLRGRRDAQSLCEQFSSRQRGSLERTKPWKPVLTPNSEHVNMYAHVCMYMWMSVCTSVEGCNSMGSVKTQFSIAERPLTLRIGSIRSFWTVVVEKSLSFVWLFATPWISACQASLSITNSWSLLKLMSIQLVMPSNHLILCHPPTFNLSQHQGLFKWVSSLYQVSKVLEFQLMFRVFASMLINGIFLHCPYQVL